MFRATQTTTVMDDPPIPPRRRTYSEELLDLTQEEPLVRARSDIGIGPIAIEPLPTNLHSCLAPLSINIQTKSESPDSKTSFTQETTNAIDCSARSAQRLTTTSPNTPIPAPAKNEELLAYTTDIITTAEDTFDLSEALPMEMDLAQNTDPSDGTLLEIPMETDENHESASGNSQKADSDDEEAAYQPIELDDQSRTSTDDSFADTWDDTPIPFGMTRCSNHPFTECYKARSGDLPTNPTLAMIAEVKLRHCQAFRNKTLEWVLQETTLTKPGTPVAHSTLQTSTSIPCEPFALYILRATAGATTKAIPLHREIVADDRPDLHCIMLAAHSRDLLNSGTPKMNNYLPGDIICVRTIKRRPLAPLTSFMRDFSNVLDVDSHSFWVVGDFFLLPRAIVHDEPISVFLPPENRNNHGWCIASGINRITKVNKADLIHLTENRGSIQTNDMAIADIFVPSAQPGQLLSSIKKGAAHHEVIRRTNIHYAHYNFNPIVIKGKQMPDEQLRGFRYSPKIFQRYDYNDPETFRMLLDSIRFGLSGCVAIENRSKDTRPYATTVSRYTFTGRNIFLKLFLSHESGTPKIAQWTRSTLFNISTNNYTFPMEVEQVDSVEHSLGIWARCTSESSTHKTEISKLEGEPCVVYQELEDNAQTLRVFPHRNSFDLIPCDAPAKRLIMAICGGPAIPYSPPLHNRPIFIEGMTRNMTGKQSEFTNLMTTSSVPAVVANSPPGTGKSTMAVATAIVSSNIRADNSLNVVCAITNAATVSIIGAYELLDHQARNPLVRLISASHRNSLEEQFRSRFDYPILWPNVLLEHVIHFDKHYQLGKPVDDTTRSAIFYLAKKNKLPKHVLSSPTLVNIAQNTSKTSPPQPLVRTFVTIYQPKIIVGTIQSTCDFFQGGDFQLLREKVVTVQIDEASQLPLAMLVTILALFPQAKTALIGDHRQLAPYAHRDLPQDCKRFAVGTILKDLWKSKAVPSVTLSDVFRCPPQITKIVADMFYQGRLTPKKAATKSNIYADALNLLNSFPMQVLHLNSTHSVQGTSLFNPFEADVALDVARRIRDQTGNISIGLLCFYKAQAGYIAGRLNDDPFFIGTIDGSQGKDFDVCIVLTTRTSSFKDSDFLSDWNRINVAISRTKEFCLVICQKTAAASVSKWSELLQRARSCQYNEGSALDRIIKDAYSRSRDQQL